MSARDDDHAAIMAEDEAGGVQYWRETAEEAMAECHALRDRITDLERQLSCSRDRTAVLASRLEARDKHCDELEEFVARVRSKCAAWLSEAERTSESYRTQRLEGYAEAQIDCADDVSAVLPKEPRE